MTTFVAREPVDLLAIVPYALGFHPEESAVLLTFGPGDSLHVRVDLPDDDEQGDTVVMLRELVTRRASRQVGLVIYSDDAKRAASFCEQVVEVLIAEGVDVLDMIRVAGGRFHPADAPDHPGIPYDLGSHRFATRQRGGRVVHASRAALVDSLAGRDDADIEEIAAAADAIADRLIEVGTKSAGTRAGRRTGGRRPSLARALSAELRDQARWLQRRLRSGLDDPDSIGITDAGRLLVLVALDTVKEVAWAEIERSNAQRYVELWTSLLRRAPRDLRPGPAGLLAFSAWLDGHGALAACALQLCFEIDPGDSLGQHVASLLDSATPPAVWAPLRERDLRIFEQAEAG